MLFLFFVCCFDYVCMTLYVLRVWLLLFCLVLRCVFEFVLVLRVCLLFVFVSPGAFPLMGGGGIVGWMSFCRPPGAVRFTNWGAGLAFIGAFLTEALCSGNSLLKDSL